MLHGGAPAEPANGFIGIEYAEQQRRQKTVATFRAKHDAEYRRMVDAAVGMKAAHQEFEAARVAAANLPHGLPMSDLLDSVEQDARAALTAKADAAMAASVAQVQQMGDSANVPTASKKKAS